MNLVLFSILRVMSRPVVCANFQDLEENTYFTASGVCQGHSSTTAAGPKLQLYFKRLECGHKPENLVT